MNWCRARLASKSDNSHAKSGLVNPISPTLDAILRTAFSFWNSKVLLTAVTFDLFTKLGQRRLTGAQIGQELALHPRGIRAAYEALPPGGAFIAVEALIDNARRENVFGLLMPLNMLIEFGDAFDYSAGDFEKWCGEVGFARFEVIHVAGQSSAAVAYK
jgi:hypothetical protein